MAKVNKKEQSKSLPWYSEKWHDSLYTGRKCKLHSLMLLPSKQLQQQEAAVASGVSSGKIKSFVTILCPPKRIMNSAQPISSPPENKNTNIYKKRLIWNFLTAS